MDALPMAPVCRLDESGLSRQLDRYRRAGDGAHVLERTPRRLLVELAPDLDATPIEEMIAIERECCPFFALDFDPVRRRLEIGVADAGHEAALEAIAVALSGGDN